MNEHGPFDRLLDPQGGEPRDRSAQIILIGMGVIGLVLFLLVLSPFSILGGGDGDDDALDAANSFSGEAADGLPEGLEAVSRLFEGEDQDDTEGPFVLTLPLLETITDGRNLGLYTLVDDRWQRVASATLVENGTAARGEVTEIPETLAVLRVTASVVQITGSLPSGTAPDPEALSAIATINPVDYAPAPDGSLEGAPTGVGAAEGNVVPTVRAATPEQDSAVKTILASPALREDHITALVQLALQPGYAGIDLDYPRVNAARKADFTSFIAVLSDQLHQANRTISVTLPLPVRAGVSWDTGAFDWGEIAGRVDLIKLSTEPDPSLFYPRMTEVLDFLGGNIDLKKVALVIGRESYEKATDGLTNMTLHQALSLASEIEVRTASQITPNSAVVVVGRNIYQDDGASGLRWDETARAVAFDYPGRGGTRTVYLENSISIGFKLDFARSYGLGGIAIRDVSDNPGLPDYWEPLRAYAESGTIAPVQPNSVLLRPTWESQAGSMAADTKGNLVWTAPAQPGAYDVALIISDGVIRASQKIVLNVQAPAP